MCSFWLVSDDTAGMADPEMLYQRDCCLERMLGYSNHLDCMRADEFAGGDAGNFPQAFTHLALISAAFNLDRNLDGKKIVS